jgi:hypothetical protein
MARREAKIMTKLAFFVEGDNDKEFIEALAPRILGEQVIVHVVRIGTKFGFSSSFYEALEFLDAGYTAIFVLVDADTEIESEVAQQRDELVDVFRRYAIADRVHVHMVVPMLEAWLLAAYGEAPERSTQPKEELARRAGGKKIGVLAAKLPIEQARTRSKSFGAFVTDLEAFAQVKTRRSA